MRCRCGICQAIRRSDWGAGVRWARYQLDRWYDTRTGQVTCHRWRLIELPTDADGRAQCPACRDILLASGRAVPEQAQMQLTL